MPACTRWGLSLEPGATGPHPEWRGNLLRDKPIRIDEFVKGFSYPISSEVFQLIEDSGYLIADLTAGNKNVYHEVGLLMGLNQARQKGHGNFLLIHNSSVGDVSKDFGFNIADFKQLRLNDTHSIGQEVKRQVAIYYELPLV